MVAGKKLEKTPGSHQSPVCNGKNICKGLSTSCLMLVVLTLLLTGCVTTTNHCGNEQRDWSDLQFPKENYCSVPSYVPFAKQYEAANKAVCKVHDNNSGKYATMTQHEADKRFLCDYIKHSEFPWGVRHVTGYLSYLTLRAGAVSSTEAHTDNTNHLTESASPSVLSDGHAEAVKNSQGQSITVE